MKIGSTIYVVDQYYGTGDSIQFRALPYNWNPLTQKMLSGKKLGIDYFTSMLEAKQEVENRYKKKEVFK